MSGPAAAPDGAGERSLVVGVGASRGVPAGEVVALVVDALASACLPSAAVAQLATVDTKADEPGIVTAAQLLGVPLVTYSAVTLAAITVPTPSDAALAALGTPSVAEASALASAPGGELIVPKRKSVPERRPSMATVAVARRRPPRPAGRPESVPSSRSAAQRHPHQGDTPVTPPPALLLVGHGTYEPAGADAFRSLLRLLGERDPGLPVGGGLTAGQPLPLADSVADLVERQGVREFVVVPLALGRAEGAEEEIRAAVRQAADRHPGTSYVRRPGALDPRPALLNALERRLEEALGEGHRTPSDRAGTTVLLVGRGSTDPEENAELFRVARLLWEGRGYAGVEAAFVTQAAPDVPSGLDRCVRLGAVAAGRGRVVVLPYFLFEGTLPGRLRQQAEGWAEANGVELRFADVIGATGELADLVRERYADPAPDRDSGRADDTVR